MNISEYLSDYEKETGKVPSPVVIRCAAWLDDAGKKFNAMGFRDGSSNKRPLADGVFATWASNSFPDDIAAGSKPCGYEQGGGDPR